jgi:hypothetical protein
MIASTIVDWDLLGQAVLYSVVFGLGVLVVAGIAATASLRAQDEKAKGNETAFVGLSAVTVVCVAGIVAAVATGIWIMTQ